MSSGGSERMGGGPGMSSSLGNMGGMQSAFGSLGAGSGSSLNSE